MAGDRGRDRTSARVGLAPASAMSRGGGGRAACKVRNEGRERGRNEEGKRPLSKVMAVTSRQKGGGEGGRGMEAS